jgi:hypothetical protein
MDNVMNDVQAKKITDWKIYAQDRNEWKSIFKQAKTHKVIM